MAATEERHRLGRDLHDAVKQELFVASMEIGTSQATLDSDPAGARVHLAGAAQALAQAKAELSELIRQARPPLPDQMDLSEVLSSYLGEWSERHRIAAVLEGALAGALPGPVGDAVVRATQEALANVARHSRANRVRVVIAGDATSVEVQVTDDGRGFDPGALCADGHGLAIMGERMSTVGATLEITSTPGQGTKVVLAWPATVRAPVSR
jgi:NarL family two-component system sensor histidine kinase LiaS